MCVDRPHTFSTEGKEERHSRACEDNQVEHLNRESFFLAHLSCKVSCKISCMGNLQAGTCMVFPTCKVL